MRKVSVAREFTRFPAGRFKRNGSTSGEQFRENFLVPALVAGEPVVVELDGTIGYGSSFLEEAFGGLVRQLNWQPERILKLLKLESSDSELIEEIKQYIQDAGHSNA